MKMYLIADKYEEGYFYDFKKDEFDHDINEAMLMPTKEIAKQFIEDQLGEDSVVVEIEIESISKNGTWSYSFDDIWNDFGDDEEE